MEKVTKGLLVFFIITTLLLGGYLVYDKVIKTDAEENPKENEQVIEKTSSKLAGIYKAMFENIEGDGKSDTASLILTLHGDGVFSYEYSRFAPYGVLGNYVIDGNEIKLTYWFNTASDTSLTFSEGTKTLIINDDGTISDNNVIVTSLNDANITKATLTKSGDAGSNNLNNRLLVGLEYSDNNQIRKGRI